MTVKNPVNKKVVIEKSHKEIEYYQPTEVRAMVEYCAEHDKKLLPYMLLGFFAGIRPEELTKVTWDMIRFDEGLIVLPASITKKYRRRVIEIEPNLREWLAPYAGETGPVVPWQSKTILIHCRKIHEKCGVKVIRNGKRHTYATMHGAKFENLIKLMQHMGHKDSKILVEHYMNHAPKKLGIEYFDIAPDQQKIIPLPQMSA